MPLIPPVGPASPMPQTYPEYFRGLKRHARFKYFFPHQQTILERYSQLPATDADVAVSLPTGTGKTVVGLVIGGFRQLHEPGTRVMYLCPNKVLADQVIDEAQDVGIAAVPLYGTWKEDAPEDERVKSEDKDAYHSGQAIGVATYSTIFNSYPRPGKPDIVICDDVHTAAEHVLYPWNVKISRQKDEAAFDAITAALRDHVPAVQLGALLKDPPSGREVELVRARDWFQAVESIEAILAHYASESPQLKHPWRRMKGRLADAHCFLSTDTIEIRPWVPPTLDIDQFGGAKRRIYVSATLDKWGHIERLMGVEKIVRLEEEEIEVPGRRMLLNLNRVIDGVDDVKRVVIMAKRTDRALVLTPSRRDQQKIVAALKADKYDGLILGGDQWTIDDDVEKFRDPNNKRAVLVLANRYDGLDLGKGLCRNTIIWKLPLAIGTQEEFTTNAWKLVDAAESRAAQRLHQGMGRCTRDEGDHVIVAFADERVAEFLNRSEVRLALPRQVRAELTISQKFLNNAFQFDEYVAMLPHGGKESEDWKNLCAQVDALAKTLPREVAKNEPLAKVQQREAKWSRLMWTHSYGHASELAIAAAGELSKDKPAEAAAWFYLASVAEDAAYFAQTGRIGSDKAAAHMQKAGELAGRRAWFGELGEYIAPATRAPVAATQVKNVVALLRQHASHSGRLESECKEALAGLAQTEDKKYRTGLRFLGGSLGLDSVTPTRKGGADGIWSLEGIVKALWEAKTDKTNDYVAVNEARQIVSLPIETAENDGVSVPKGLRTTCITRVPFIDETMEGARGSFLVARPTDVHALAEMWFARLLSLQRRAPPSDDELTRNVEDALRQLRATADQVLDAVKARPATERLIARPVTTK